jgi:hypothetical protein
MHTGKQYFDARINNNKKVTFILVFETVVSPIVSGYFIDLSCPFGRSLLSCGMENTQTSLDDRYRYARPLDLLTCQCFDKFGLKCVAWCTNLPIPNFELVNKIGTTVFSANCLAGNQVCALLTNRVLQKY